MTIVVTRNVENRIRGFLASIMLEIAPGVYISPRLNTRVHEQMINVLKSYWMNLENQGIVVCWNDKKVPCGIGLFVMGSPPTSICDYDGLFLSMRPLTEKMERSLKTEDSQET